MGEPGRCPDGGTCHHECSDGCFRVAYCEPLSGVFPRDEWPRAEEGPRLSILLTDEQVRLYRESPTFRHGVDGFLKGVVPAFLDGLAQRAIREDARVEAALKVAMRQWP